MSLLRAFSENPSKYGKICDKFEENMEAQTKFFLRELKTNLKS